MGGVRGGGPRGSLGWVRGEVRGGPGRGPRTGSMGCSYCYSRRPPEAERRGRSKGP